MKIPTSLIQKFMLAEFNNIKESDEEYNMNSPFVKDTNKKFYMNKYNGKWIDYKDHSSGYFLTFIKRYLNMPYNEIISYLLDNYDFNLDTRTEEQKKEDDNNYAAINNFFCSVRPRLFNLNGELVGYEKEAFNYLSNRKIDSSYIKKICYIDGSNTKYDKRVFIPFFENGKVVYGVARTTEPNNILRYLNIKGMDSKKYLFNIDNINEEVVICEGVFDAMSLTVDQPATALLSADIGREQLKKLFDKKVKTIIYVPDKDETGKKKMNSNISKLFNYCPYEDLDIYIFDVPDGCKDLNDMVIKTGKNYILKKECRRYSLLDKWGL